jgi:hypothetical protein
MGVALVGSARKQHFLYLAPLPQGQGLFRPTRAWARTSYRHRAKRDHGLPSMSLLQTGAVTFVQRVDSAIRLNVHAHTLALDGVYVSDAEAPRGASYRCPSPRSRT